MRGRKRKATRESHSRQKFLRIDEEISVLEKIPDEILAQILCHLDVQSIGRMALLSKRLNGIFNDPIFVRQCVAPKLACFDARIVRGGRYESEAIEDQGNITFTVAGTSVGGVEYQITLQLVPNRYLEEDPERTYMRQMPMNLVWNDETGTMEYPEGFAPIPFPEWIEENRKMLESARVWVTGGIFSDGDVVYPLDRRQSYTLMAASLFAIREFERWLSEEGPAIRKTYSYAYLTGPLSQGEDPFLKAVLDGNGYVPVVGSPEVVLTALSYVLGVREDCDFPRQETR